MFGKETRYDLADIGCGKATTFEFDVVTIDQCRDDTGVSRRSTDAVFFKGFN